MTGTQVAVRPAAAPAVMTNGEIDQTFRVAKALSMSGMFKDAKQAEVAFAKILIGRDLGLSPTQAMIGIDIIEGKPELSANLQATFVRTYRGPDGERYDFRRHHLDNERCVLEFFRRIPGEDWVSLGTSEFTIKDARDAGLAGRQVWQKYPRNMLFARAMSNGVAFCCPEVNGGVRAYGQGEIGGDEVPPDVPADPPTIEAVAAADEADLPWTPEVIDGDAEPPLTLIPGDTPAPTGPAHDTPPEAA